MWIGAPTLMVALLAPKRLRKVPVEQFLQPFDEEVLGYDEDEIEDDQDFQLDITLDDSINRCFQTIEQNFDILINNTGTAGRDQPPSQRSLRQLFDHGFSVNVTSAAALAETVAPLLEKSTIPKVIFISSHLGSIARVPESNTIVRACAVLQPEQIGHEHAACLLLEEVPYTVTGLNGIKKTKETNPKKGAIRAVQLVLEGTDGVTGTCSEKEGLLPWSLASVVSLPKSTDPAFIGRTIKHEPRKWVVVEKTDK